VDKTYEISRQLRSQVIDLIDVTELAQRSGRFSQLADPTDLSIIALNRTISHHIVKSGDDANRAVVPREEGRVWLGSCSE
jgi:hypothetical protein